MPPNEGSQLVYGRRHSFIPLTNGLPKFYILLKKFEQNILRLINRINCLVVASSIILLLAIIATLALVLAANHRLMKAKEQRETCMVELLRAKEHTETQLISTSLVPVICNSATSTFSERLNRDGSFIKNGDRYISSLQSMYSEYCQPYMDNSSPMATCLKVHNGYKRGISSQSLPKHFNDFCGSRIFSLLAELASIRLSENSLKYCEFLILEDNESAMQEFEPIMAQHDSHLHKSFQMISEETEHLLFAMYPNAAIDLFIIFLAICLMGCLYFSIKILNNQFSEYHGRFYYGEAALQNYIHSLAYLMLSIIKNQTLPRLRAMSAISHLVLASNQLSKTQKRHARVLGIAIADLLKTELYIIHYIKTESQMSFHKVAMAYFNLRNCIEDCVKRFEKCAREKKVKIRCIFSSHCPTVVLSDEKRIETICAKILSSAIDRSTNVGKRVNFYVTGSAVPKTRNTLKKGFNRNHERDISPCEVLFEVHDYGPPITSVTAPSNMAEAFQNRGGENLRIFEAQRLCESLHCKFAIISVPSHGNTVMFSLKCLGRVSVADLDSQIKPLHNKNYHVLTFSLNFEAQQVLSHFFKTLEISVAHCPCLNDLKLHYKEKHHVTAAVFLGESVSLRKNASAKKNSIIAASVFDQIRIMGNIKASFDFVEVFVKSVQFDSDKESGKQLRRANQDNIGEVIASAVEAEKNKSERILKLTEPLDTHSLINVLIEAAKRALAREEKFDILGCKDYPKSMNLSSIKQHSSPMEYFGSAKASLGASGSFYREKTKELKSLRKTIQNTSATPAVVTTPIMSDESTGTGIQLSVDNELANEPSTSPAQAETSIPKPVIQPLNQDLADFFCYLDKLPSKMIPSVNALLSTLQEKWKVMEVEELGMELLEHYYAGSAVSPLDPTSSDDYENDDISYLNYDFFIKESTGKEGDEMQNKNGATNQRLPSGEYEFHHTDETSRLRENPITKEILRKSMEALRDMMDLHIPEEQDVKELVRHHKQKLQRLTHQSKEVDQSPDLDDAPQDIMHWINWDFNVIEEAESSAVVMARDLLYYSAKRAKMKIDHHALLQFAHTISHNYKKSNPFHNFYHALSVAQISFLLQISVDLGDVFDDRDRLLMSVAALGHDVKHPGVNNLFLSSVDSFLSRVYNDVSVLENYHATLIFQILRRNESYHELEHFFNHIPMRRRLISAVISTDMSQHYNILNRLQKVTFQTVDMNQGHSVPEELIKAIGGRVAAHSIEKIDLESFILHGADISNPLFKFNTCKNWGLRIAAELHKQIELEKKFNIPPHMPLIEHINSASVADFQINFIDTFCFPYFIALKALANSEIAPRIEFMIQNRKKWVNMKEDASRRDEAYNEKMDMHPTSYE